MKAIVGTLAGVALVLGLLAGSARTEEKAPSSPEALVQAIAEAGKPGPEHAKLEPFAGKWAFTCKFWMDPSQPPAESKGTIERTWILGGRFLEERMVGTGFDGKSGFESRGMIGYDKGQAKYTTNWVCSMCTSTCTGLGAFDETGKQFTVATEAFCPLRKQTIKGREAIRIVSADKVIAESYHIIDGKEVKMMELVSVRQK